MATNPLSNVLRRLRGAEVLRQRGDLTDGQLLTRFLGLRDEAAFETLLRRHGPMVLGVCRRVLLHDQDAEDAFQATFLVLARKAGSVAPRELVGNWLYGVAYNTALKARALNAKRRDRERQVGTMPEPQSARQDRDLWSDLQPLLDRELSRLPDKYRFPVVLCDLEGKTHKEAARQLGCPEGTVSVRLSRARALLARRLTQRGLVCTGTALAAVLSNNPATACVPAALAGATVEAANLFAAGHTAAAGLVSERAAILTEGVLKTMWTTKCQTAVVLLVLLGVGLLTYRILAMEQSADKGPQTGATSARPGEKQKENGGLKDLEGVWKVVKLEGAKGRDSEEELKGMRWTFKGSTLYLSTPGNGPDNKLKCSIKVDPSKNPKHIDVAPLEGPSEGKTIQGIYKLEKGRLILCMRDEKDADQGRPKEFVADQENGQGLATLERVTEKDKLEKPGEKQKDPGGLKELEGAWRVVALEVAGKKIPQEELKVMGWTFRGATLLLSGPGKKFKCAVKVEPSKNPKHIDVTALEGPSKGKTMQGIYKLAKGRLTICMREDGNAGQGRPKEFATDAENGLGLATLDRVTGTDKPAAEEQAK